MKKRTKAVIILFLILVILLGLGGMAYPLLSSRYLETVQSKVQTQYIDAVTHEQDTNEIDTIRQAAMEYNRKLYSGEICMDTSESVQASGYYEQLVMPNTDAMCIIRIPCINVVLPVYHGIGDDALNRGCGHLPQSSLPVGGANTHAVISAHTGMASSPMFSDLVQIQVGDLFYLDVLDETLTYEVYNIETVLPADISKTQIKSGEDLCTLVTCTPIGVNTHRLLVQGKRIPTPDEPLPEETQPAAISETQSNSSSAWEEIYWQSIKLGLLIIAILVLVTILIVLFLRKRNKNKGDNNGKE